MKPIVFAIALFGSAFPSGADAAAPAAVKPSVNPTPRVISAINHGFHRSVVLARMGPPSAALSRDVWLYLDVAFPQGGAGTEGRDALVVEFVQNRVSRMRVSNTDSLKALLARIRSQESTPATVSR